MSSTFKQTLLIKTPSDGWKYLIVSLFLIMLSFFIMLNSISQANKKKSEKVLMGVRYEFAGKDIKTKLNVKENEDIAGGSKVFGIKEQIENVLKKGFFRENFVIQKGLALRVDFRDSSIFSEESGILKASGEKLLRRLFTSLKDYTEVENFSVEISLPASNDTANDIKKANNLKNLAALYSPDKYNLSITFFPTNGLESEEKIKLYVILNDSYTK